LSQDVCNSQCPVHDNQAPLVTLIAGFCLSTVSEILSVWRIEWGSIGGLIESDLLRFSSGDGNYIEIPVGGYCLLWICIHGVADFLSIRRDCIIVRTATAEGRNIEMVAGSQVFGLSPFRREGEELLAPVSVPFAPVTVEK